MSKPAMSQARAERAMKSIAINKLVDLIVPLVRLPSDSVRQTRDKVRQRLLYAVNRSNPQALAAIGADDNYTVDIEQATAWARTKWPTISMGTAHHIPPAVPEAIGIQDGVFDWTIPGDISRCQASLETSHRVIRAMRDELKRLRAENARLVPLAKRYAEICEANRKSARKPRNSSD